MRPWGPARHFLIPSLVLGIVAGCGGGGAGVTGGTGTRKTNTPPSVTRLEVAPGDLTLVRYKQYAFTATASDPDIGDRITRYDWDFGGGSTFTTTGPTVQYAFVASGTQTVKVRAYDSTNTPGEWASFQGTVDSSTTPITVAFTSPTGSPTVQADLGGYVQVAFAIHATTTSTSPIALSGIKFNPGESGASVVSSADLGGGDFSIVVRYPAASATGQRTVTPSVLVSDISGVSSDLLNGPTVTISTVSTVNRAPVVTVTNPASPSTAGFTSKPVSLGFTVSDEDADQVLYTVDWGDGTVPTKATTTGDTKAGILVSLAHTFPDAFTATTRSATVRLTATDNRSSNANAVDQTRTYSIQFNAYPTATITTPQASATLPANSELTGGVPTGWVNPPGPTDPDIVVIPNGSKLNFQGTATLPGSGDPALAYSWTFPGGSPATSNIQTPGDVTFFVAPGTTVPQLVELKVTDAFQRSSSNGPSANAKTFRKWVVVDGVNTQTFNLSYVFRQKSDNNGTVSLTPARTAANGLGSTIQIFQDGVTNSFQVQNFAGQAIIAVPVRSNLPFYASLGAFGADPRTYLMRIPNAPTGPYADPGLGTKVSPTATSFGFQASSAPWNPTLQVVTAEGFAPETASASERRMQGSVYFKFIPPATLDPLNMVIGNTPSNNRWVDRLAVPMLAGDALGAIQWAQGSNAAGSFQGLRANQLFAEWVMLGLSEAPKDVLLSESPVNVDLDQAGNNSNMGFVSDYAAYVPDAAKSKTFALMNMEAFRVPPSVTDPYDLNVAGWDTPATTIQLKPAQIAGVATSYNTWIYGQAGSAPLGGGLQAIPVPYDANDPDRRPTVSRSYNFIPIRSIFSSAEYLWSSVWARPLVLNAANLSWAQPLGSYAYFRRSAPSAWPAKSGILPDNSAFDMRPSGAGTFDAATVPVGLNGSPAPTTGIGRFYWTAFTPFYNAAGGAVVTRTWLSDASGNPPTSFSGGAGDATSAMGFQPPQDVMVDKRGRRADGSLNGQSLGGYRVTWFNGTKDSSGDPVAPDFWVVEVVSNGKTGHFMLPGSFPAGTQSVNDLILTDARTFLPSGNSSATGAAAGDKVAPGYCWFDIPVELRPNAGAPAVSSTVMVFGVKAILKNAPPAGARKLTQPEWIDAIKTVTANVQVKSIAGDFSYAHKIPFNYYWDIVVVNGPQTFVAP